MAFTEQSSFVVNDAVSYKIKKYVSTRSKMRLIHIDSIESPIVKGHFVFATEMTDSKGTPFALEKMIFTGSKKYAYNDFLAKAGEICMSSVKSSTKKDHTIFQLTSVGWNSFKKMTPAILDHLFHPNLTEEAFINCVHYVSPETFKNNGEIFLKAEQRISRSAWTTDEPTKNNTIFDDKSGYRFEEEGIPSCIQDLTLEEVQKFHKDMYTPDNMCVIIHGAISKADLLEFMTQIDQSFEVIADKRVRPFVETDSAKTLNPQRGYNEAVEKVIQVPRIHNDALEMRFSWITALSTESILNLSLHIVFQYLIDVMSEMRVTDTSKPALFYMCTYSASYYYRSIMSIDLLGLDKDNLEKVKQMCLELFKTQKVDMKRMKDTIMQAKKKFNDASKYICTDNILHSCIKDFLYNTGKNNGNALPAYFHNKDNFHVIDSYTEEDWQAVLDTWISRNAPSVFISEKSKELLQRLNKENAAEFAKRNLTCDKEASKRLQNVLQRVQQNTKAEIPKSLLTEFILENPADTIHLNTTRSVPFIDSMGTSLMNKNPISKPSNLPFFIHVEDFTSNAVEVQLMINARCIEDVRLIPYVELLPPLLSMPMKLSNGKIMSAEDVLVSTEEEFGYCDVVYGYNSSFDTIDIRFCTKAEKYGNCVKWIKHLFYDLLFDKTMIQDTLEEYADTYSTCSSGSLLHFLMNTKLFDEHSSANSLGSLFCSSVFQETLHDIENDNYESCVLPKLEKFRKSLLESIENWHVLVLGSLDNIGGNNLFQPWIEAFGPESVQHVTEISTVCDGLTDLGGNRGQKKAFVYVKSANSEKTSDLIVSTSLNIGYDHKDIAAIMVADGVMKSKNAPLSKLKDSENNRFSATVTVSIEKNEIKCNLTDCTDAIESYKNAQKAVNSYVIGESIITTDMLYEVVCSKIKSTARRFNSLSSCGERKFENIFGMKVSPHYDEQLLAKMSKVTVMQVVEVIGKYFARLFDIDQSAIFVGCPRSYADKALSFLESKEYMTTVEDMPKLSDS